VSGYIKIQEQDRGDAFLVEASLDGVQKVYKAFGSIVRALDYAKGFSSNDWSPIQYSTDTRLWYSSKGT